MTYKHARSEQHRLLRILYNDPNTTLPLPILNAEVRRLEIEGLARISEPRRHKHYMVVDIELTAMGLSEYKCLENRLSASPLSDKGESR